jgi:hypothetical protein
VVATAFLQNTSHVVSTSHDKTVRLWDFKDKSDRILVQGSTRFQTMQVAPNEQLLAVAGGDEEGREKCSIQILSLSKRKESNSLAGHTRPVTSLCFSPDSTLLASADSFTSIRIWSLSTGKAHHVIAVPTGAEVSCVAFSLTGQFLFAGYEGGGIRVYSSRSGLQVGELLGHESTILSLSQFASSHTLISADSEGQVRSWDLVRMAELRNLQTGYLSASASAFSRDGKTLAYGFRSGRIVVVDVATGAILNRFQSDNDVWTLHFSALGDRLVSGGGGDYALRIWDLGPDYTQGQHQPKALLLRASQIPSLLRDLSSRDPQRFHSSAWQLLDHDPEILVKSLGQILRPTTELSREDRERLRTELVSERFSVRKRALEEVEMAKDTAFPLIRQLLADPTPLDLRRALERILNKGESNFPPTRLLSLRAVALLERVGTQDSWELLKSWSTGMSGTWLTEDARAAILRKERARVNPCSSQQIAPLIPKGQEYHRGPE